MNSRAGHILLFAVAVFGGGCEERSRKDRSEANATAADARSQSTAGYPRARWRLATFDELNRTVVWVSHIVIRPSDSNARWFRAIDWAPDPPAHARTEAEAIAIAEDVRRRAVQDPKSFPRLAREYSEDVISRERGGSLGGVRASQLPSDFLDALATLKAGEISRVFRTPFGFHILMRNQRPEELSLSGRRIGIAYEGTVGLSQHRVIARSRSEARLLAVAVAEQAKRGSVPFTTLVRRHSDLADSAQEGDLGVWSTLDPEFLPSEIELLGELSVGQVSDPLETRFGFEILQRIPVRERRPFAMTAVELKFDPTLPADDPNSEVTVRAKADRLAAEIRHNPGQFAAYQASICCKRVWRWTEGRGPVGVTAHLEQLKPGEIAPKPLPYDWFFLIARRLDPSELGPSVSLSYELPNPERPDFMALLEFNDGKNVAAMARDLASAVSLAFPWEEGSKTRVVDILEELAISLEKDAVDSYAGRVDRVKATLSELQESLGDYRFQEFQQFAVKWATDAILG